MKRKRNKSASRLTLADKKVIEAIVMRITHKCDKSEAEMTQEELCRWFEDMARRTVAAIESSMQY